MKKYKLFPILFIVLIAIALTAGPIQAAEKININKASIDDLTSLSKIGPKIAERIVQFREKHGEFSAIEDIMKVKGIGQKTFETIKDMISIE
jgi:competence protein ComEA